MKRLEPIRYVDAETGTTHEEQVYGGFWIRLLYGTLIGRAISALIAAPPFSLFYGWLQDRPGSRRKVAPFIKQFDINMADFLPEPDRDPADPYATFNQFFTRRVVPAARPFAEGTEFPAPCDARYFGYQSLSDAVSVPVKGACFKASALLGKEVANKEWNDCFEEGPGFVARLCPVDYHRFHFPDAGTVLDTWRIPGALHSVNPWALAFREDIFMVNERQVTILDTAHFGRLAYVEVGATCVGRIVQTHGGNTFSRGDEKGMFLFGGSTVIVIGERGCWQVAPEIVARTNGGIETYVMMGRSIGSAGETGKPGG